jgi:glycosyltransferase involved in cell wall biosynthesis
MKPPQRVAIVHEWFTSMRGGEKCVEALCELFPSATVFALVHVRGSVSSAIERMPIRTSFVQHLPFAKKRYRHYLPLFPTAVQQFNLNDFDLVISSNHCVAKGVHVPARALHICYCHTPMRYIWDLYEDYFRKDHAGFLTRLGMRMFRQYLRRWDIQTAQHPHHFIANSENVRRKIEKLYNRSADIIYPPVDTSLFQVSRHDDGYYLIVSAFVPYKRIDLAIEAFNKSGDPLVIVGDGPDNKRLRSIGGPSIRFVGWQPNERLKELYARCTALVFPGEEDFGIVPLEAMASGKPVIAYARGGALETVHQDGEARTGILFQEQTAASLMDALGRFKKSSFDPEALRAFALRFDREVYKRRMKEYIEERWSAFRAESSQPHILKHLTEPPR